ncbi:MAG: sugar phosphate nucleotidyltransferase [Flavobacteriales bacterium]
MKAIEYQTLAPSASIREALEALNRSGRPLTVLVVDGDGMLCGSLTDGDIRRAIISGQEMDMPVSGAMNPKPWTLVEGQGGVGMIREISAKGIRSLPIVDGSGKLLRLVDLGTVQSVLPIRALIMAGGRGRRLRPFTDNTPKPLIPVRGKPIIEHALGLLERHGIEDLWISVNYLKEQIMEHVGSGEQFGMRVHYIEENAPLGTAGALADLPEHGSEVTLMMNSDLLTDVDLEAMYERCLTSDADIVVATIDHVVDLPYAVLDLNGDVVQALREKPSLVFPCNAGIYLIRDRVLQQVPKGVVYNATDLVQDVLDRKGRVVAFPIEGLWHDIGKHEDLQRAGRTGGQ